MSSSSDTSLEEGEIPQEESNQADEAISGSHRGHSRQSSRGAQDDLEELQAGIHTYTRAVGLQDCLKDFPGVCDDLERALAKARAMFRLLHQKDPSVAGADASADLAKAGVRLLNGVRSLHVFSTTGQGRDMAPAQEVVRTAWRDRELLFTTAQRKQLEGWLRSSKRLAALLPRDAAGLFEPAQPSQQPGAGANRHAAPVRRASEPALAAKQAPAAAASRNTAGAIAACPQPTTASVGEKRSQASDEDSGSSTGGSSKRSKPGRPMPAAQQPSAAAAAAAPPPPPPPPPLPPLANGAAATAPPRERPPLPSLAPAVELVPPSPPRPLSPQQNSTGSASMELSHSAGAPSTVAGPSGAGLFRSTAGSAAELQGYQSEDVHPPGAPAASSSQFHGVVVSEDVRGLLG